MSIRLIEFIMAKDQIKRIILLKKRLGFKVKKNKLAALWPINFINGEIDGNSIFSYGGAEPPKVSDFFEGDQEKRWGNNECLANDDRINKLIIRPLDPNKGFTIKGEIINNVLLGSVEDRQWNIGVTSGMPCKGTIKNVFPKVKGKYINESYNFCYKWEYSNTNPSLMKIK